MRDFKARAARIEPAIGSDSGVDEGAVAPAAQTYHDVLMDAAPRANRAPRGAGRARTNMNVSTEPRENMQISGTDYVDADDYAAQPLRAATADRSRGPSRSSSRARRPRAADGGFAGWNRLTLSWLRPAHFAVLIVFGCLGWAYWASDSIAQFLERPFKSVVVEGDFQHVSKQRSTELIGQEIDSNFLKLDLMRIKHVLLDDPWVDSVSLQRRWPDTLVVKIIEQKPIARWTDGFLNQRGEIIRVADTQALARLPWLQGSEANASDILQQYLIISQRLRTRGLDVIALKCDDKRAWRLTLNNNVEVVLGRGELIQKVQRFMDVYDSHLSQIWTDIVAIDARYSNGVAVRWVEGSQAAGRFMTKSQSGV